MARWIFIALLWLGLPLVGLHAAEPAVSNDTAMVMFHGTELFKVTGISSISAKSRAKALVDRFVKKAKSPLVSTKGFSVHNDEDLKISAVMSGPDLVFTVWESDAELHNVSREKLAENWRSRVCDAIDQYRKDYTADSIVKDSVFAAITTLAFLVVWFVVRTLCRKEVALVGKKFSGQKMFKFLDGDSVVTINGGIVRFSRFVLMLWLFILYLNLVLSFFPWTYNYSARLFQMVSTPIVDFGHAFVTNLPNLFALVVIGGIVWFILRGLKHIFEQVGEGKIRINGFYRDWADPTYRLIRIVVVVFAVVVAFPFIPGSSSPAFKGISIFMGVLLSLGSTSAVGNIVAGLVLTYMRPFVSNDFVEISGLRGTVVSRGTFSTRLKTPTNEIISIPNASVSANHIINFSRMTEKGGVNVGTSVTIGYDVPWRTIHELLISAAAGVPDVLENPAPKVLQISLDDFYVQYRLIVTTKHPEFRIRIRSDLHKNIQDRFAEAGIEIMSPHYQSNRAGESSTIPDMESPFGTGDA